METEYRKHTLPLQREGHYTVPSPKHYHVVREALFQNTFMQVEGSPWPTASLDRGDTHGHAQLKPPILDEQPLVPPEEMEALSGLMWKQREELSDLDADVLDGLSAIWLGQVRHPNEDAVAGVDDFLALRGIRPRRNSEGRPGGYRPQQRNEMLCALSHIQNLWLHMVDIEIYEEDRTGHRTRPTRQTIQSRAFVITDRIGQLRLDGNIEVQKFIFRPGKVFAHFLFGPGRQTALISAKALEYDPYRQKWEKRLARYLSWQWKCQARRGSHAQPFRIATLMEAIGEEPNERYPQRTRDRLELALDTLHGNKVIMGWQYGRWEEPRGKARSWLGTWLQATVLVEPPQIIQEAYERLALSPVQDPPPAALHARVRARRKALSLTQSMLSERLGVSQACISDIERGKILEENLSARLRDRLLDWLEHDAGPDPAPTDPHG